MTRHTDKYWQKKLTPGQYHVLRQKGTEAPYSGALLYEARPGEFTCTACGAALFNSETKFESHCGWPSFYDAKPEAIEFKKDTSLDIARTEVICHNCGSHLGHLFEDSPEQPTGQRYCINSVALNFNAKQ